MRITTRAEYRWDETAGRYLLVSEDVYHVPDNAPIALCKGPSQQQNNLANSQQGFYNTLQQDYGTTFGNQAATLKNLTNSLTSTIQGGSGQYGYGAQEDAALRTQSDAGTAQAYKNAKEATGENIAAVGGGNAVIPQGITSVLAAQNANAAAQQQSNQQLGITQQGYEVGRNNYNNAVQGLSNVASLENPNPMAGQATGAGQSAYGSASNNQQMRNQSSPWNIASGLLGGVAGSFLNPIGKSVGSTIGTNLFGSSTATQPSSSNNDDIMGI